MSSLRLCLYLYSSATDLIMPSLNILGNECGGHINIVAATAEKHVDVDINGIKVPFLPLEELPLREYDCILVCGMKNYYDNFHALSKTIKRRSGNDSAIIIPDRVICFPGFSLKKHLQLLHSQLSILSLHCFGGLVSHLLTLPFLSPFINLYSEELPFLSMLRDPRTTLSGELEFQRMDYNRQECHPFPVFSLNGLPLHFQHYSDVDIARDSWNQRMLRINWYNLMVVMYTNSRDVLERFDALPYAKKVCFVPFQSKLESAYPLLDKQFEYLPINDRATRIGWGEYVCYNLWDMLLYGKKTGLS